MRHNNNGRRFRGRHNNGGGGGHSSHHSSSQHNQQRRVNPRVQIFDSNGPDVRIRGNAIQITEKYQTLARDANSAGDRVMAESYLQHAEHYQRMLNEAAEEFNRHQAQTPQHNNTPPQQGHHAPGAEGQQHQQHAPSEAVVTVPGASAGSDASGMSDLDQGFLVGPRHGQQPAVQQPVAGEGEQPSDSGLAAAPSASSASRHRGPRRTTPE
jgi:hypothetical protein